MVVTCTFEVLFGRERSAVVVKVVRRARRLLAKTARIYRGEPPSGQEIRAAGARPGSLGDTGPSDTVLLENDRQIESKDRYLSPAEAASRITRKGSQFQL